MNELYIKDTWINPNIQYIFNTDIIEYDMKSAGLSLTKEYNLLPKKYIEQVESKSKKDGTKLLGIYQRDIPEYREALKEAFQNARKLFYESNSLEESGIISIKKDAIFVIKKCQYTDFGKHIHFRKKNEYTSYIHLYRMVELYYNSSVLDVKGIDDEVLKKHDKYMLEFLKKFINKMETEDPIKVIDYVRRFIDKYKMKELDADYYRRFDSKSEFDTNAPDNIGYFSPYSQKEYIDISFNYQNVLLKLIKIPL